MGRDTLEAALRRLSGDFEVVRGERGLLAVRPAHRAAIVAAGLGPDAPGRVAAGDLRGRGPMGEVHSRGERLVVRPYRHGGLLRWLSGERYRDPCRPFRELWLGEELARRGIATPLGVAAWAQRMPVAGWRLALVTRREEGALDVERALLALAADPRASGRTDTLFAEVGEFLGRVHGAGFVHVDLNAKNLLVDEDLRSGAPTRVRLLDLDRCWFEDPLPRARRVAMLARLLRYLERRPGCKRALSRARLARFLRAYEASAGRGDWHRTWRDVARRRGRARTLHRVGWFLEDRAGRGRARSR